MRLLITRQLCESIDGIQLVAFRPGYVYQVGSTIGNYLLAVGAAEPAADDAPYIVLAPEKQLFLPEAAATTPRFAKIDLPLNHNYLAVAADWAAERPKRSRRLRLRLHARKSGLEARVTALATEIRRIRRDFEAALSAIQAPV